MYYLVININISTMNYRLISFALTILEFHKNIYPYIYFSISINLTIIFRVTKRKVTIILLW